MYEEGWNNGEEWYSGEKWYNGEEWYSGEKWYNGRRWDGLGMEGNDTKMSEKIKCNEPHALVHSVRDFT
jgi:hypothetical protein